MPRPATDIRRQSHGLLSADDERRPVRFVVDRAQGRLVAPLHDKEIGADELVLFVPDEREDAWQLLVKAAPIDEGRATDRWIAYHARPDAPLWATMSIDLARKGNDVVDGPIDLACPFAAGEPGLCNLANQRPDALAALCAGKGKRDPSPVLVGVDAEGLDIRTRTGLVRIEFREPVESLDEARDALESMLDRATKAPT
jgi:hypothetical protein